MDQEGEEETFLRFLFHTVNECLLIHQVNLFEQELVLLPIHLRMHWCLAVIDFSQKKLAYYDSLLGSNLTQDPTSSDVFSTFSLPYTTGVPVSSGQYCSPTKERPIKSFSYITATYLVPSHMILSTSQVAMVSRSFPYSVLAISVRV